MSFLDHIHRCNTHDLSAFTPWFVGSMQAGWVHRDTVPSLRARPQLFHRRGKVWRLSEELASPAERTAEMERFLLELRDRGLLPAWRGERYPVTPRLDLPALLDMERGAVALFGVRAFGVHLTGYVERSDGLHIWVPRRAGTKATYPGMLDNTVAGGQPSGISVRDNMIKECGEEAGIPPHIARRAISTGFISYVHQIGAELKPDVEYCFDLALPADFVPHPHDGEAESFELWPVRRVFETVRDSAEFKDNCNLVLIDFFVRHGLIAPDDTDYFEIAAGLRSQPLPPTSVDQRA